MVRATAGRAGTQPGEGGTPTTLPAGAVADGKPALAQADSAGDLALATGIATWGRVERRMAPGWPISA